MDFIPVDTRVELTGPIHDLRPSSYANCHEGTVIRHYDRAYGVGDNPPQNHCVKFDNGARWWVAPSSLTVLKDNFESTGDAQKDAILRVIQKLHRRQQFYKDNKASLTYWP